MSAGCPSPKLPLWADFSFLIKMCVCNHFGTHSIFSLEAYFLFSKATSATLKGQNLFLTDSVLTLYTVTNSKTIPVLPKPGGELHLQESKANQEVDNQI